MKCLPQQLGAVIFMVEEFRGKFLSRDGPVFARRRFS
jgi:hypothetical protein